jgi:hypothetical protein
VFTLMAIVKAARSKVWQFPAGGGANSDNRLQLFLLLWTIIPIIFFSISRSKLPGYILPSIPAAAMLTADYLHRMDPVKRWSIVLHSIICGGLVGAALAAPARMLKVHPAQSALAAVWIGAGVTAILVLLIVRLGGAGLLRLATLIPVIVILAFLLGPAAPIIDDVSSTRTVDARLRGLGIRQQPVAVFNVKREVEYGLNFYRNQPINRYERDGVPSGDHVVIAPEGNEGAVQASVGRRQVSRLGGFPPQHLEFFLISKR